MAMPIFSISITFFSDWRRPTWAHLLGSHEAQASQWLVKPLGRAPPTASGTSGVQQRQLQKGPHHQPLPGASSVSRVPRTCWDQAASTMKHKSATLGPAVCQIL